MASEETYDAHFTLGGGIIESVFSMAFEENHDALFTFEGGDVNLITTYKGKRTLGKVSSQAMVLASPVRSILSFSLVRIVTNTS